jgi:hypothetical protein
MSFDIDPNALASALPSGIDYDVHPSGTGLNWHAKEIAEFQSDRLAESGYRLVYVGDNQSVKELLDAVDIASRDGLPVDVQFGEPHAEAEVSS